MKLLFIVVLSLLAVSYAWEQKAELATRGRKKDNHSSWGGEGGESYLHREIFKCFESARKAAKLVIL